MPEQLGALSSGAALPAEVFGGRKPHGVGLFRMAPLHNLARGKNKREASETQLESLFAFRAENMSISNAFLDGCAHHNISASFHGDEGMGFGFGKVLQQFISLQTGLFGFAFLPQIKYWEFVENHFSIAAPLIPSLKK